MTIRYTRTEDARSLIHKFVEAIRRDGIRIVDSSGLLPEELTPLQISNLIDRHFGIDRARLDAERAATREPGAECACGE